MRMLAELNSQSDRLRQFQTLSTGCLSSGDILMLPAGYVLIQKSVNCDTIGLRVNCHLLSHDAIPGRCHCFCIAVIHVTLTWDGRTDSDSLSMSGLNWLNDNFKMLLG